MAIAIRLFAAFFLIVLGLSVWTAVPVPEASSPMLVWPFARSVSVFPIVLPAIGIPIGAGLVLLFPRLAGGRRAAPPSPPPPNPGQSQSTASRSYREAGTGDGDAGRLSAHPLAAAAGALAGALSLLAVLAAGHEPQSALRAMLVTVCAAAACATLALSIRTLSRGERVEFVNHWGGLGGGMGGWRLSTSAVTLLLSLILLSSAVAMTMTGKDAPDPEANKPAAKPGATAPERPAAQAADKPGGASKPAPAKP